MAKGRPDWTSSINITGQDLSEVISRPKYGEAEFADYAGIIAEDDDDILFSVTGTGMIYGGSLYHLFTGDTDYVFIIPEIDGIVMTYASLAGLMDWQTEDKNLHILFDQYYSEENDKYINGITRGITFESSFLIGVFNAAGSGASDDILAELWYALI